MLGIPLTISSAIKPDPNFLAISPCIQTAAQHAKKLFNLLFPIKLEIIPLSTSPVPITANSLDVCLFKTIFPCEEHMSVFDPFNIILHLHIFLASIIF